VVHSLRAVMTIQSAYGTMKHIHRWTSRLESVIFTAVYVLLIHRVTYV